MIWLRSDLGQMYAATYFRQESVVNVSEFIKERLGL